MPTTMLTIDKQSWWRTFSQIIIDNKLCSKCLQKFPNIPIALNFKNLLHSFLDWQFARTTIAKFHSFLACTFLLFPSSSSSLHNNPAPKKVPTVNTRILSTVNVKHKHKHFDVNNKKLHFFLRFSKCLKIAQVKSVWMNEWNEIKKIHTWWRGRPTIEGKTALGASSPAKPALHIPDPLSTTRAATSSSHMLI